jgi:metal-responsive CopG/Arc/MetJ family transcriptional regulator
MAIPKKVRRTRFDIMVSDDTLAAIDDYRFATRAPNRVEAVRRLLKAGLQDHSQDEHWLNRLNRS